jgi:hypothetical protein
MPTNQQAIHLARAAAFAIALSVPAISTLATTAYADNETPASIAPPYRAIESDQARSTFVAPPASAKTDATGASGKEDEVVRSIYRPGVSDR